MILYASPYLICLLDHVYLHVLMMFEQINTQLIPPSTDLLNSLPSGRDIHSPPGAYKLPSLDDEQLAQMRAPPDDTGSISGDSDEEGDEGLEQPQTPGAYPERTDSAYY